MIPKIQVYVTTIYRAGELKIFRGIANNDMLRGEIYTFHIESIHYVNVKLP
jgi:hypothetical protein